VIERLERHAERVHLLVAAPALVVMHYAESLSQGLVFVVRDLRVDRDRHVHRTPHRAEDRLQALPLLLSVDRRGIGARRLRADRGTAGSRPAGSRVPVLAAR